MELIGRPLEVPWKRFRPAVELQTRQKPFTQFYPKANIRFSGLNSGLAMREKYKSFRFILDTQSSEEYWLAIKDIH